MSMFPGYQNMISHMTVDQVKAAFQDNLKFYNANENDCRIENIHKCHDYDNPFKCRYQLHWNSYVGWKVYMLHTGCLASDPRYE